MGPGYGKPMRRDGWRRWVDPGAGEAVWLGGSVGEWVNGDLLGPEGSRAQWGGIKRRSIRAQGLPTIATNWRPK